MLTALIVGLASSAEEPRSITREQAEAASRLTPQALPGLPAAIVRDLDSRGCTIPQSYILPRPQNAIQGQFYRSGQTDWAVLCSHEGASAILIYPEGKATNVEQLARQKDQLHIETVPDGTTLFGFTRLIRPVGEEWIVEHHDAYGGPEPPPIDHDGIDDAYVEHGSVVRYWHLGRWQELTGAD